MHNSQIGKHEIVVKNAAGDLEIVDLITGEVIQNNTNLEPHTDESKFVFNYAMALMICHEVRQGRTLSQIGNDPKFVPQHIISHWQRTDKMFAEELKLA